MTVKRSGAGVTKSQYPKFFAMLRRAALNLGIDTPADVEEYRHQVMMEEAGCASIKDLNRTSDFDACIRRFAADAGDYADAVEIGVMEQRRRAYVVVSLCAQIMQITGRGEAASREYLEGVMAQARVPCGTHLDNSFWMDVSPRSLQNLLQILDTHRRRLLRSAGAHCGMSFCATVRYIHANGAIAAEPVERNYYLTSSIKVTIR